MHFRACAAGDHLRHAYAAPADTAMQDAMERKAGEIASQRAD